MRALSPDTCASNSRPFSFADIQTITEAHVVVRGERLRVSRGLECGCARAQGRERPFSGDIAALWSLLLPASGHNHEQHLLFASCHWAILLRTLPRVQSSLFLFSSSPSAGVSSRR